MAFDNLRLSEKQLRPIVASFTAPLVAGAYVFSAVQAVYALNKELSLYVDNMSLTANIDQLLFSNAIDASYKGGFVQVMYGLQSQQTPAAPAPTPFASFVERRPVELCLTNVGSAISSIGQNNTQDQVTVGIDGRLVQTPELILAGVNSISILITANAYQISSKEAITYERGGR